MKKLFALAICYLFFSSLFCQQNGSLISYSPQQPVSGDTLQLVLSTNFPSISPSGSSCGSFYHLTDTIVNNQLLLTAFFDFCYTGIPPNNCFRTDTINYTINQTGISSAKIFWKIRSTLCVPIVVMRADSAIINFNATGLSENRNTNFFNVSPNPVSGKLFLKNMQGLRIQSLQFYDTKGSLIKELPYKNRNIDVADLLSGLYFLKIKHEHGVETVKVVKE